jgi:hypothetical protein
MNEDEMGWACGTFGDGEIMQGGGGGNGGRGGGVGVGVDGGGGREA